MTGYPMKNKEMFDAAQSYLEAQGFEVINPCNKESEILDRDSNEEEYLKYMREDIFAILFDRGGINQIWTLPDWWNSRGAKFEVFIAQFFRIPINHLEEGELRKWMKAEKMTERS